MTVAQRLFVLALGVWCIGCTPLGNGPAVRAEPLDQRPAGFTPQRQSSTTMATWIAAWEDQHGDLHAPSTIYVEVDPTKWTYGDASSPSRYTVLRPLQVEQRAPPTEGGGPRPIEPVASYPLPPGASRRGA